MSKSTIIQICINYGGHDTSAALSINNEIVAAFKFYNLIKEFYKLTSVPVILNTSFNIKGQPMVNNPSQAINTFMKTNIDVLAIGDFLVTK